MAMLITLTPPPTKSCRTMSPLTYMRRVQINLPYRNGPAAMSALGQKQTFAPQNGMSALPPIATSIAFFGVSAFGPITDMKAHQTHVRFTPQADIRLCLWRGADFKKVGSSERGPPPCLSFAKRRDFLRGHASLSKDRFC